MRTGIQLAHSSEPVPLVVYEAVTHSQAEAEELAYRDFKQKVLAKAKAKRRWTS